MGKIGKFDVSFNGLLETFVKLVQSWDPPPMRTENDYSDHLAGFLRESVPDDTRIEREYRHHGTTMDLFVSWKGLVQASELFFELKRDLKRKSDFDRLVGQIEGLDPKVNSVLVVLIGETDPALLGRLREKYVSFIEDDDNATLAILTVSPGKPKGKAPKQDDGWF